MKKKSMSKNDVFIKNMILGEEFTRYMIEHPEFAEKIPEDAEVILLPEDDPELAEYNKKMATDHVEEGTHIVYITIEGLEEPKSRLINPRLKLQAV